ncbi:MAG: DUF3597 domain-containing protein [Caulobacteraceae bacterium]|nr:DUF3597 domain-containing protein [Caulobacter sp.]
MSIFGTIMSKIFGSGAASAAPSSPPADTSAAPPTTTADEKSGKANTWQDAPTNQNAASGSAAPSTAPSSVDVAKVLDGMDSGGQKLDWRHSIVDLMKLLHMDSSHEARKQLAQELHYTGDMNDSAAMNMWLHKEVMRKLAENGGKLPADMH